MAIGDLTTNVGLEACSRSRLQSDYSNCAVEQFTLFTITLCPINTGTLPITGLNFAPTQGGLNFTPTQGDLFTRY